jgi:hypothetical protein
MLLPNFVRRRPIFWVSLLSLGLVLCLITSPMLHINYPVAGPLDAANLPDQQDVFRQIATQQKQDLQKGEHLRFRFDWPQQKWVSFAGLPDGSAEVVVAEASFDPDGKLLEPLLERNFVLSATEYRDFLAAFDQTTNGYRYSLQSGLMLDGESFAYERWENGKASHYGGNAGLFRKDFAVMSLVVKLVRRHSGFALDRYAQQFR